MPLVANTGLPSFARLEREGSLVIPRDMAQSQEVRELHIGLLNMMPDKALEATERQFFRLVGGSNQIARFYLHPFTLEALQRSREGREHVDRYYKRFEEIRSDGLDALIITGANVVDPALERQEFWNPLIEVVDWACANVTSILCSCPGHPRGIAVPLPAAPGRSARQVLGRLFAPGHGALTPPGGRREYPL